MKKKIVWLVLLMVVIATGLVFFVINREEELYLISNQNTVTALDASHQEVKLVRGQKVRVKAKKETIEEECYRNAFLEDTSYFVPCAFLSAKEEDIVMEKELLAYRSSTLYEDENSSEIKGLLKKGEKVNVLGYSGLKEDGTVDCYHIKAGDVEGYVLSKYVTAEETVDTSFLNEYPHSERGDLYGGGSAETLDYFKNEKPVFEDNVMPEECRTLYLNVSALSNVDAYIELALSSGINAFVIDIKDSHIPSYASSVMKEYSMTSYENAVLSFEDFKTAVKKVNDAGIYTIGRITVFKDTNYAIDHKEDAIFDKTENDSLYFNGSYWPSAYARNVWEYNVKLAKEAVSEMGFKEIQFDYVRFPDRIDRMEMDGKIDLLNHYDETKAEVIQRFIMYACDELHPLHAYVSIDVFGETSNAYVTAYGQYWPAISNVADVISAMPYPDHFAPHDYGISEIVWEVPYTLLSIWGSDVAVRQSETPSPAIVRTWIQGYDSIVEPYVVYDTQKILDQINALKDQGLNGGYIIWNAASSLAKYDSYKEAFKAS